MSENINRFKVLWDSFQTDWDFEKATSEYKRFLQEYPKPDNFQDFKLELNNYTNIKKENDNYFTNWIERKTEHCGKIGATYSKFGIYRMNIDEKKFKKTDIKEDEKEVNEDEAEKYFNEIVFPAIKSLVNYDEKKHENIELFYINYARKVAYMYNADKLIPIYKTDVIKKIANYFGINDVDINSYKATATILDALKEKFINDSEALKEEKAFETTQKLGSFLWKYFSENINLFKNIIYHGAPGTGKTYELKQEIQKHLDVFGAGEMEFVQFHGAYSYEDFIGGLKPDNLNSKNGLQLKFTNGIFKELCKKAARYEIAYYKDLDKFVPLNDKTKLKENLELRIDDNETITIKKDIPVLSQFPPFFILIDEINRADLSRVFGELLYAIEDDYRGFEHKFKLATSNMEDKESAVYWVDNQAYFFVPKNIYIRGTMNDIDKSVDSIDFAFRRRFKWVNKKFDVDKVEEILLSKEHNILNIDDYKKSCKKLNSKIVDDISIADESYKIGHAIFANISKYLDKNTINKQAKKELFDNHIEPIIYNYLKMDYGNEKTDTKEFRNFFVGN